MGPNVHLLHRRKSVAIGSPKAGAGRKSKQRYNEPVQRRELHWLTFKNASIEIEKSAGSGLSHPAEDATYETAKSF